MINLEKKYFLVLEKILEPLNKTFYVFGSRVKNSSRKYSDLDLAYKDELDFNLLLRVKAALSESDLPFKVDLVQLDESNFSELIKDDLLEFKVENLI